MRLLDLVAGEFVEFSNPSTTPPYAILSHRWDTVEQTYQNIREIQRACERNRQSAAVDAHPSPCRSSSHDDSSTVLPPSSPQSIWDLDSGLSAKVRNACEVARKDGFQYLWIDSCCIDKTSSSELSESINSMFAWYRDAIVCYAFLADVPTLSSMSLRSHGSAFRLSEWFTRGWTLQELIAPPRLVFLSQGWEPLGTKSGLAELVEEITGIPASVLTRMGLGLHLSLEECSVAQRMSWAAKRETTKVEDQAYSLLGIFDIQMSTLYGEGERAFRRLQEEILRRIPDQTIFAWGLVYPESFPSLTDSAGPASKGEEAESTSEDVYNSELRQRYMFTMSGSLPILAHSPSNFIDAGKVVSVPHSTFVDLLTRYWPISPQEYTSTPHGIRTNLPLLPLANCLSPNEALFEVEGAQRVRWYLAVLACEHSDFPGQLLCRICHVAAPERPVNVLHRGALLSLGRIGEFGSDAHFGIVRLALNEPWLVRLRVHTVFLDHPSRSLPTPTQCIRGARTDEHITFALPTWCRDALNRQGYATSLEGPSEESGGAYRLALSPRRPTNSTSDLPCRWSITADFSYEKGACRVRICAAVHISGNHLRYTKHLEWLPSESPYSFPRLWPCHLMSERLELALGECATLKLELGVQLVSASCYHIHADVISDLPVE